MSAKHSVVHVAQPYEYKYESHMNSDHLRHFQKDRRVPTGPSITADNGAR